MQEAIMLNFSRELTEDEKRKIWNALKEIGKDNLISSQSQSYDPEYQFPVLYFP